MMHLDPPPMSRDEHEERLPDEDRVEFVSKMCDQIYSRYIGWPTGDIPYLIRHLRAALRQGYLP
jgi:hypothetical protein